MVRTIRSRTSHRYNLRSNASSGRKLTGRAQQPQHREHKTSTKPQSRRGAPIVPATPPKSRVPKRTKRSAKPSLRTPLRRSARIKKLKLTAKKLRRWHASRLSRTGTASEVQDGDQDSMEGTSRGQHSRSVTPSWFGSGPLTALPDDEDERIDGDPLAGMSSSVDEYLEVEDALGQPERARSTTPSWFGDGPLSDCSGDEDGERMDEDAASDNHNISPPISERHQAPSPSPGPSSQPPPFQWGRRVTPPTGVIAQRRNGAFDRPITFEQIYCYYFPGRDPSRRPSGRPAEVKEEDEESLTDVMLDEATPNLWLAEESWVKLN